MLLLVLPCWFRPVKSRARSTSTSQGSVLRRSWPNLEILSLFWLTWLGSSTDELSGFSSFAFWIMAWLLQLSISMKLSLGFVMWIVIQVFLDKKMSSHLQCPLCSNCILNIGSSWRKSLNLMLGWENEGMIFSFWRNRMKDWKHNYLTKCLIDKSYGKMDGATSDRPIPMGKFVSSSFTRCMGKRRRDIAHPMCEWKM